MLVADKRRGRNEKKEKYQPARFDDGSHESEEARLLPRSFDFHYKTLKKIWGDSESEVYEAAGLMRQYSTVCHRS